MGRNHMGDRPSQVTPAADATGQQPPGGRLSEARPGRRAAAEDLPGRARGRRAPVRRDQRLQTRAPGQHPDRRGRRRLPHLLAYQGRPGRAVDRKTVCAAGPRITARHPARSCPTCPRRSPTRSGAVPLAPLTPRAPFAWRIRPSRRIRATIVATILHVSRIFRDLFRMPECRRPPRGGGSGGWRIGTGLSGTRWPPPSHPSSPGRSGGQPRLSGGPGAGAKID